MIPFGWSAGDLITAAELITTVVRALQEANGSASKYRTTDAWLTSITVVLRRPHKVAESAAQEDIARVLEAVESFQEKFSRRYGATLGTPPSDGWKNKIRRIFKKLDYIFVEGQLDELRKTVGGALDAINLHLAIDSIDLLSLNTDKLDSLLHQVGSIGRKIDEDDNMKHERERKESKDRVLKWLWLQSVADVREKLEGRREKNVEASGDWLKQRTEFTEWLNATNSESDPSQRLLWITGIPGAGKTGLATSVIDELLRQTPKKQVAYFYCDTQVQETTRLVAILRTWYWQLVRDSNWNPDELAKRQSQEQEPSESILKEFLGSLLAACPGAVIVLDGLDECEETGRQSFIKSVLPTLIQHVKLVIFSRQTHDVSPSLAMLSLKTKCLHVDISPKDNADDIRKFITRELEDLDVIDTSRDELVDALERRAHGMFQWVALMVEELKSCLPETYFSAVEEAPEDLYDFYDSILRSISQNLRAKFRREAKILFQWLTCANRPLTLVELDVALKISMGQPYTIPHRTSLTMKLLKQRCGSLVTISDQLPTVSLAHASVKDYLLDKRSQHEQFSDLLVDEEAANLLIADMCLRYLCHDDLTFAPFEVDPVKQKEANHNGHPRLPLEVAVDAWLDIMPLQRYVALQWPSHVINTGWESGPLSETSARYIHLINSGKCTIRWLQAYLREAGDRGLYQTSQATTRCDDLFLIYSPSFNAREHLAYQQVHKLSDDYPNERGARNRMGFTRWQRFLNAGDANDFPSDIHVAAFFGFEQHLGDYLARGGDANITTFTGQTPLHFAARGESLACTRMLLDHGAKVDAQGWSSATPLAWSIDMEGGNTASLHMGRFDTAALLLEAGADPFHPVQDMPMARVLQVAIMKKHLPQNSIPIIDEEAEERWLVLLVEDMFKYDTDKRKRQMRELSSYLNLLHFTAKFGVFRLFEAFVKFGADVNGKDDAGRTPLDVVLADQNHEAIRRLRDVGGQTSEELMVQNEGQSRAPITSDYWPRGARDIFNVYRVLQLRLQLGSNNPPRSLVTGIMDQAEYWLKSTSSRNDKETYDEKRANNDSVYLRTAPIPGRRICPVREIKISIASHDQGWSNYRAEHGTFSGSWTWFECDAFAADGTQRQLQDAPGRIHITSNLHAVKETTQLSTLFSWQPEVKVRSKPSDWLKRLEAGDEIVVYAKARFPGWVNHVESVAVEIYSTCLLDEAVAT